MMGIVWAGQYCRSCKCWDFCKVHFTWMFVSVIVFLIFGVHGALFDILSRGVALFYIGNS